MKTAVSEEELNACVGVMRESVSFVRALQAELEATHDLFGPYVKKCAAEGVRLMEAVVAMPNASDDGEPINDDLLGAFGTLALSLYGVSTISRLVTSGAISRGSTPLRVDEFSATMSEFCEQSETLLENVVGGYRGGFPVMKSVCESSARMFMDAAEGVKSGNNPFDLGVVYLLATMRNFTALEGSVLSLAALSWGEQREEALKWSDFIARFKLSFVKQKPVTVDGTPDPSSADDLESCAAWLTTVSEHSVLNANRVLN